MSHWRQAKHTLASASCASTLGILRFAFARSSSFSPTSTSLVFTCDQASSFLSSSTFFLWSLAFFASSYRAAASRRELRRSGRASRLRASIFEVWPIFSRQISYSSESCPSWVPLRKNWAPCYSGNRRTVSNIPCTCQMGEMNSRIGEQNLT